MDGLIPRWALIIGAVMAVVTTPMANAADAPPIVLARSGKWDVNYDDDSCSALAVFGTDQKTQIVMRLTWFKPGDNFQLMLVSRSLPTNPAGNMVDIDFGPAPPHLRRQSMNGHSGELPMIIIPTARIDDWDGTGKDDDEPKITPEQERAVQWLDVHAGFKRWRLAFNSSLAPVITAVRACTRDLVKTWGYDPAVIEELASEPVPKSSPASWLRSADYPVGALTKGAQGLVRFRLDVDATGEVTSCHVLKGVTSPDFEKTTCDLLGRRARFKPALASKNVPVRAYYVSAVKWLTGF